MLTCPNHLFGLLSPVIQYPNPNPRVTNKILLNANIQTDIFLHIVRIPEPISVTSPLMFTGIDLIECC